MVVGAATVLPSVHPAATESETAAWLSLLETRRVHASLDMAPLAALRRRPKLNARTLDDVETECRLTLTWDALPPLPDVRPPGALVLSVSSALAAALDAPAELITAEQASSWAGRTLTADELDRLSEAIPHSSIPDAIDTIAASWD